MIYRGWPRCQSHSKIQERIFRGIDLELDACVAIEVEDEAFNPINRRVDQAGGSAADDGVWEMLLDEIKGER